MAIKKNKAKPLAKKPKVMAVKKPGRDNAPVKSIFTKSQMIVELSRVTLLTKQQIRNVFDELSHLISRHIKKGGPGLCTLPGVCKIITVKKPSQPAREGINPFTKEKMMFKAKPARMVLKIRALKALKNMV